MGGSSRGSRGEGRFFTNLGVVSVVVAGGVAGGDTGLSVVAGLGVVEYLHNLDKGTDFSYQTI